MADVFMTDDQKDKIIGLIKNGLNKLLLNKQRAQNVIEFGDIAQDKINEVLFNIATGSMADYYTNEEIDTDCSYPREYKPTSIEKQINVWQKKFPGLSTENVIKIANQITLPMEAENLFIIPKWNRIAEFYVEAVKKMLTLFSAVHKYANSDREIKRTCCLSQSSVRSREKMAILSKEQSGDYLVVPAQFGLRHRGKSSRRSKALFLENEFELGIFAVTGMLMTHPKRIQYAHSLSVIDCGGDEYFNMNLNSDYFSTLLFYWSDHQIFSRTRYNDVYHSNCGLVSAFLPY